MMEKKAYLTGAKFNWLAHARQTAGLSLEELANLTGYKRPTLYAAQTTSRVSREMRDAVIKALGLDANWVASACAREEVAWESYRANAQARRSGQVHLPDYSGEAIFTNGKPSLMKVTREYRRPSYPPPPFYIKLIRRIANGLNRWANIHDRRAA
jgi:transcriptional regulator with XRE-family HTH domain